MVAKTYTYDNTGKEVAMSYLSEALATNDDIRAALGISDDEWSNSYSPTGKPIPAAKIKRLVARIDKDIKAGSGGGGLRVVLGVPPRLLSTLSNRLSRWINANQGSRCFLPPCPDSRHSPRRYLILPTMSSPRSSPSFLLVVPCHSISKDLVFHSPSLFLTASQACGSMSL
nr:hypothetical protein [Candidatus Sigynarchaeota archaeon]